MLARVWVGRFRPDVLDHLDEGGDSVSGVENVGLARKHEVTDAPQILGRFRSSSSGVGYSFPSRLARAIDTRSSVVGQCYSNSRSNAPTPVAN